MATNCVFPMHMYVKDLVVIVIGEPVWPSGKALGW